MVYLMYVLFDWMNGEPFEFLAGDSHFYDDVASIMSDQLSDGDLNFYDNITRDVGFSDRGYPLFLSIVYTLVFKSILLTRFVHAFIGAWSCVLIYDFAKRNFNQATARLAGVIMVLLPNLIYYAGLHLKETVMVFLVVVFINYSDKLLKEKVLNYKLVLIVLIAIFYLFMFRTVLAVSLMFAFFLSVIVVSDRIAGQTRRILVMFLSLVMLGFVATSSLMEDVNYYLEGASVNQESQLKNFTNRQGGNKLAQYGSKAIFAPLILSAPFPTLANTDQENQMMISGAVFTHSVYSFFAFFALFFIFKQRLWRKYSLLLGFVFSYLMVLLFSGFVLSERFHLPVLPFIAILSAYGVTSINTTDKKYQKYYVPFLIFITLVIIGWNWFKLAGRDLI